ncbi:MULTISPECIES: hypothetical protein [Bacillus]|uniref:hypothetical protein n=1 Tax=Bacillus TaxID=1386 RepID=UPI000BB8D0FE|nr:MULTISPECIES: hypothetical protein [Bacillus]
MKMTEYMGNKVCTFQTVLVGHKVTIEFMFLKDTKEVVDYSIRIDGNPTLEIRNNINKLAEVKMYEVLKEFNSTNSISQN